jgi:hypothetical protein
VKLPDIEKKINDSLGNEFIDSLANFIAKIAFAPEKRKSSVCE